MATGELGMISLLLVDNDKFSLNFANRLLGKMGVQYIQLAMGVEEAFETLRTTQTPVHIVITDIDMPEHDGFELVRRLRYGEVEGYKDIPIIMLTGQDTARNIRRGGIHKINGFIVKPPKEGDLRREILKVITG